MTRCTCDPDDDTSAEHRQCVACYEDASVTDPIAALLARIAELRARELDAAASSERCVDPIREAQHRHAARVLDEVARAAG